MITDVCREHRQEISLSRNPGQNVAKAKPPFCRKLELSFRKAV
jgi:hypothetical protein